MWLFVNVGLCLCVSTNIANIDNALILSAVSRSWKSCHVDWIFLFNLYHLYHLNSSSAFLLFLKKIFIGHIIWCYLSEITKKETIFKNFYSLQQSTQSLIFQISYLIAQTIYTEDTLVSWNIIRMGNGSGLRCSNLFQQKSSFNFDHK